MCIFTGHKIYFFLSGIPVKNIHKSHDSRERERLFLSTTLTPFANRLVFSVCSNQRNLMMNEDVTSGSRNCTHFFIIKTSTRVNKWAGFLDLPLNINFQPLIIAVKHPIIKLYVTELLDPP